MADKKAAAKPATEKSSEGDSKKTVCPITRDTFREEAKPLTVKIGDQLFIAEVKEFSTGSLGWYLNAKTVVEIDGVPCSMQIGANFTLVGSKELQKD